MGGAGAGGGSRVLTFRSARRPIQRVLNRLRKEPEKQQPLQTMELARAVWRIVEAEKLLLELVSKMSCSALGESAGL